MIVINTLLTCLCSSHKYGDASTVRIMVRVLISSMTAATPTDTKTLWKHVLSAIETSVSPAVFRTWFKGTHIVRIEEGVVVVGVPNLFAKDWIYSKHHKTILKTLRELSEVVRSVEYVISTKAP